MDKVIFRTDEYGVTAYFPDLPHDREGKFCTCYAHVGQHSGADLKHCLATSKEATPEEYAALKNELENIGYRLDVQNG